MQDFIAAGFNDLAYDIIKRGIKDRETLPLERCEKDEDWGCNEIYLRCVKNFFITDWFEGLCELAGRDAFAIRRKYGTKTTAGRGKTQAAT